MKNKLFSTIESYKETLTKMADDIFDNPEYDGEEVFAAKLLTDFLKDNGFEIELGIAELKTAFRAEYKNMGGGAVIGILCEYDALKGLGHGCGHHMQGPACLGAAIAIKQEVKDLPYTIVIYGTPAEETTSGKCQMLDKGCFKELDVALMMHGASSTCTDIKCLALAEFNVEFIGVGSHAAIAPEKGKSAFDASMIAFNGIEFLREHVSDDVKMHYTITELPGPSNIVPKSTKCQFVLRSFSKSTLDKVIKRFENIVKGAALIADVEYQIEPQKYLYNKIPVLALNQLLMENAELANTPCLAPPREKTGSTDFGNVMYEIPGSCIRVAFVPEGTASHSMDYIKAGKTKEAHECIMYAAKAIAGASLDLICNEDLLKEIKREFKESKELNK